MSIQLESTGVNAPSNSDYVLIGKQVDRIQLNFTNIQGNGQAYVYLRSVGKVRRIDSIPMFDLQFLPSLVFWDFEATDELAVNLVGYSPDIPFRATLDIGDSLTGDLPSGELQLTINSLDLRISAIEQRLAGLGSGNNDGSVPSDFATQLTLVRGDINSVKTTQNNQAALLTTLQSTVSNLQATVTNNFNSLTSRIDAISSNSGSGTGDGITNIIQNVLGGGTKTLDASLADRFDLVMDSSVTLNVTNVINTSNNERSVVLATLTKKRGLTRLINNVDVWLTADGQPPATEQRVGFGDLVYLTNIHGAVFGQVKQNVQFRYQVPDAQFLQVNVPFVGGSSPAVALNDNGNIPYSNFTTDVNGGIVAGTSGAIVEDPRNAQFFASFAMYFTFGTVSNSTNQRLLYIFEDGYTAGLANLSMSVEESGGNLFYRYRKSDNTVGDQTILPVLAGVPYALVVRQSWPTTNFSEWFLRRLDTNVDSSFSVPNFTFNPTRRTGNSHYFLGASSYRAENITNGSKIRGFAAWSHTLSIAAKNKLLGSYL